MVFTGFLISQSLLVLAATANLSHTAAMSPIKSLLSDLGAGLALRWRHFRLGREGAVGKCQERQFRALLHNLAATDFGRSHHLTPTMSWQQFQGAVAPGNEALDPDECTRMASGLLAATRWPHPGRAFVPSRTTTAQSPRFLPVTPDFERHLQRTWREALLMLSNRETTAACLRAPIGAFDSGNHLSPGVESLPVLLQRLSRSAESPGAPCLAILDEAEHLDQAVRADNPLRWLVPLAPVYKVDLARLARRFGTGCIIHEVAATPAGIYAVQDRPRATEGLRLLVDAGLFLEFLPLAEYLAGEISRLGPRTLRLDQLPVDTDAVLFLTGPSGSCRFDTGEVVRLISASPPRAQRMGRTETVLPLAGEPLTERVLADALECVCTRQGWDIVHLHVAPHGHASLTGQTRGAHEWWIELRPGSRQTPTGQMLAEMIDAELKRLHPGYARQRTAGRIQEPIVRLVIPGVFDAWRERAVHEATPATLPVSLPTRRIANVLASFTRFHDA